MLVSGCVQATYKGTENIVQTPSISQPIYPEEDEEEKKKTYILSNTSGIRIRSGAGSNYSILGQIEKNDMLAYNGKTGNYYITTYKEQTGYIHADYCSLIEFSVGENKVEKAISFDPEHISAYALKIEPGTLFYQNKNSLILPSEDSEYNMYKTAVELLGKNGYVHYEISNYAKQGFKSRHNLKYWNCEDYAGFGPSAHSCIGRDRYAVISNTREYIKAMLEDDSVSYYEITESLSIEDFFEEYIMMRMRLGEGLSLSEFKEKFSNSLPQKYIDRFNLFQKSGHIIYNNGRYSFTDDGMYLSNYILSEILDLE